MRRQSSNSWAPAAALLLALGAALPAARAAVPHWAVRASVTVAANVVRVGDLLAPAASAPESVRRRALSAAPQPGTPLRWSASQLATRLLQAGLPANQFTLPKEIVVRRAAQPIPAAAVLAALQSYLKHPVAPGAIRFTAPLTTAADPAVRIIQLRPDRAHGRLDVICRARHDASLLPFVVAVALPAEEIARQTQAHAPRLQPAVLHGAARGAVHGLVLVRPGHSAQFNVENPGFALTTLVQPLQPGRLGDQIRVRNLATHAILHVVVTGPDAVGPLTEALPHAH